MDPLLVEFARYGIIGLSFGVLLWATLRDKDRMAIELNADKERLLTALTEVSMVVANNTTVMRGVQEVIEHCKHDRAA